MRPVAELARETCRGFRGFFCDIDDTLTTEGRLTADAYGALECLHRAQLVTVPVTGRPAGWCDHIVRMWPVDGIVGENGAFYFRYDRAQRRMYRRFADSDETRAQHRSRLESITADILRAVPDAAIASDQRYRETDLAIDYSEDVPRLPDDEVERIVQVMRQHGLTAKVSSIHVNGWFGQYDKLTMTRAFMAETYGIDLDAERTRFTFVGDSPNDAPMFRYFPHAIGVANLRDFGTRLEHEPAYISDAPSGAGFREIADFILSARSERLS